MADAASRREQLRDDFLAQTARIAFGELQRYFAAGKLVHVASSLDLIQVAIALAEDDTASFETWLAQGHVALVSDSQAAQWLSDEKQLWAVVADPWVLVQDRDGDNPV